MNTDTHTDCTESTDEPNLALLLEEIGNVGCVMWGV